MNIISNGPVLFIIMLIAILSPIVFWSRGIIKGNKSDLILGVTLIFVLPVVLVVLVIASGNPQVFTLISLVLFLFSLATLVAGYFAKPECPINKKYRIIIAIVILIVLGALWFPVM